METWKKLKRILPVIGIAILVYIIVRTGPGRIVEALYSVQLVYLIPVFLFVIGYLVLQTYKWKYILDRQGIRLGFAYLLKTYLIGMFYSTLTPGKLGTFIRIGYIRNETGKSLGECSSGVVLEKVIDIICLVGIGTVGIALLADYMLDMLFMALVAGLLFVILLATFLFFMRRDLSARVMRIVYRLMVPSRLKLDAKEAFEHFYENMPKKRVLIVPFIVTILSWFFIYTINYLVALSLGINVPYFIFVTIFPIATLIGLIPVTISGWGTREAALIGLFSPFSVEAGSIIAMSILAFILTGLVPAIIGAGFSLKEK